LYPYLFKYSFFVTVGYPLTSEIKAGGILIEDLATILPDNDHIFQPNTAQSGRYMPGSTVTTMPGLSFLRLREDRRGSSCTAKPTPCPRA